MNQKYVYPSFYSKAITIDSFKLRIPLSQVKLIDGKLDRHVVVLDANTGEEIQDFKEKAYSLREYGKTTWYAISTSSIGKDQRDTFVCILINSKILEGSYQNGISNKNIKQLFDTIIAQDVIEVSFDNFLDGLVTDCDFKKDILMDFNKDVVNRLCHQTKTSIYSKKGVHAFRSSINLGVQWSDRKKGTPQNPYLKIYHKGIELKNKAWTDSKGFKEIGVFYGWFIKETQIDDYVDDMVRVEFTIKDKKHFNKVGIKYNRLSHILNIPNDENELKELHKTCSDNVKSDINVHLEQVLRKITDIHLNRRIPPKKVRNDLTPTQIMQLAAIRRGMMSGDFNNVLVDYTQNIENEKSKYNMVKNLTHLYEFYIKNTDIDSHSKNIEIIFSALGL